MKRLYLDTETTGLNPEKHQIIQLAGIIEIDGEEKETFNLKCKTFPDAEIDDRALEVCKTTREIVAGQTDPDKMFGIFVSIMDKHVDKYNASDKFVLCGQNIFFDRNMLFSLAARCGNKHCGSYFHGATLDLLTLAAILFEKGAVFGSSRKTSFRLSNICKTLQVELGEDAHDALVDIKATRSCILKATDLLKEKGREDADSVV